MFLSDETLTELIGLDVPPEKLARILRMIERDAASVTPRRSSGAERQRRYRERKSDEQPSEPVTEHNESVTARHKPSPVTEALSPSPPPRTPPPRPHTREEIYTPRARDADFERFWEAYPVKKSRKTALAAYLKALGKTDHGTLVAAVDAQRRWPQWRDGFIPHAATWLNAERWLDEPEPERNPCQAGKPNPGGNRPKPVSMVDILVGDRAAAASPPDLSDDGWISTGSDGVFVRGPDGGQPF